MQTFAQQLHAIRRERHITQEQLAQELNVSRTTVSRWESGKTLPDIETIKRLSQVLSYNFFTVEGLADAAPQEEAHDEATPEGEASSEDAPENETPATPAVRKRNRGWLYAAGGLCLLLIVLLLSSAVVKGRNSEAERGGERMYGAAYTADDRAEMVVTPDTEVAYLVLFNKNGDGEKYGWTVNFTFENRSDVPFTPDRVVARYYCGDKLHMAITVGYDELRPWMGNDKLLSINDPLNWPFGTDQLYLTHITVTIYGTDDNGNRLEASATVQYLKEYADGVQGP